MLQKDIIQEIFQYISPKYHTNFRLISKLFDIVYNQNIDRIEWYSNRDDYTDYIRQLGKNNDIYYFKKEISNCHPRPLSNTSSYDNIYIYKKYFYIMFLFISNTDNKKWIDYIFRKIIEIKYEDIKECYFLELDKTLLHNKHYDISEFYYNTIRTYRITRNRRLDIPKIISLPIDINILQKTDNKKIIKYYLTNKKYINYHVS